MGSMTNNERATREYLADKLAEQGYATYAQLFELFDLRLISNPTVIGYMEPGMGRITLNETLDEHTLCLVIRHEILHEYLTHELRLIRHVAKQQGLDPEEIDNLQEQSLKDIIYGDSAFNIAGDYEISNRGYTEQDKKDIRRIRLNGEIVSGLVTEIDHPDWVDLPLEDMYDLLKQEMEENPPQQPGTDGNGPEAPWEGGEPDKGKGKGKGKPGEGEDNGEGEGDGDGKPGGPGGKPGKGKPGEGEGEGEEGDGNQDKPGKGKGKSKKVATPGGAGHGPDDFERADTRVGKIIHGTYRHGRFFDSDGKEIIPGGNA